MKKLLIFIILLFAFFFTACDEASGEVNAYLTLPDLTGMSREEISKELDRVGIKYSFHFADVIIRSDDELDKFVSFNGDYKAGDRIKQNYLIYVYTTVLPLTFSIHEEVKMDFDYQGKSFVNDGVGEVTLSRSIDGDTAHFIDSTGEYIKVRFLGIDTPESTIDKEPWGKAASSYTANKLNNAKHIVLESEGSRKDNYERYLGFVWVDGELLNLELIEQAYTTSTLSNSKYEEYFMKASSMAKKTGRRFFGEIDPNYDYVNHRFK